MSKSVEDNALLLSVIAGADPRDPTSSRRPVPNYLDDLGSGVKRLRLGLPKTEYLEYATTEVGNAVRAAARILEQAGASIQEVELPHVKYAVGAGDAIQFSEAAAYHQKYLRQGRYAEYTPGAQMLLDAGRFISAVDYVHAQRLQRFVVRDFARAFEKVDALLAPVNATDATRTGENPLRPIAVPAGTLPWVYAAIRMTKPASLAGVPALAVPCGFSEAGLPLSLQIMAAHFNEAVVFRVGAESERATNWRARRPSIG